jgi:outer membrane protein assembly factor BamB
VIADGAGDSQATPGGVVMNGNTLYLGSQQAGASSDLVTAFNLDSGTQLWSRPFPGANDVIPLTATGQRVVVVAVYSTSATASLTSLTRTTGSPGTARALDGGEESAFNNLTMNVETPYAMLSGSRLAVGFPSAITSGATLLGVLPPP